MQIFKDYDKMLKHYDSCKRMNKRYAKLFSFSAIVLMIVSIVNFINKNTLYGLVFLITALTIIAAVIYKVLLSKYKNKNNPAYEEIFNDLRKKQVIKELGKTGLQKDKIDCIADPNFSIKIGYLYTKNIYYCFKIYLGELDYGIELTDKMYNIPADIFDRYFKKKYGKYKTIKIKGFSKTEIYEKIASLIVEDDEIRNLEQLCNKALDEAR